MIPRIAQGHVVSCQYWDGTAKLNENPAKSKTAGKWLYGVVPGSDFSGKRIHRSISSPLAAISSTSTARARRRPPISRCGSARARTAFRSCPTR